MNLVLESNMRINPFINDYVEDMIQCDVQVQSRS